MKYVTNDVDIFLHDEFRYKGVIMKLIQVTDNNNAYLFTYVTSSYRSKRGVGWSSDFRAMFASLF